MTIIMLDHDRLKICLDQTEMHEMGLDENRLDYREPAVKTVLVRLLQKARAEAGFHPRGAKLIVEVLPDENDGCVLCFTAVYGLRLSPSGSGIEPVVYAFKNAVDLVNGIGGLYKRFGHRIYQSSLYEWENGYRLVIRALDYNDRQSDSFLCEYSARSGSGEAYAAWIDEHGRLLAHENAVDVIGRALNQRDAGPTCSAPPAIGRVSAD